jgi:hypothetical protein
MEDLQLRGQRPKNSMGSYVLQVAEPLIVPFFVPGWQLFTNVMQGETLAVIREVELSNVSTQVSFNAGYSTSLFSVVLIKGMNQEFRKLYSPASCTVYFSS